MTPKKMNPLVACLRFCATLITTASAFKFSSNSDSVYTTDTTPYKTIRFVGSATSSLNLDNVVKEEERRDYKTSASPRSFKSLSKFLSSDASNAVLLGTPDTKLVRSTAGDFWVCRMERYVDKHASIFIIAISLMQYCSLLRLHFLVSDGSE